MIKKAMEKHFSLLLLVRLSFFLADSLVFSDAPVAVRTHVVHVLQISYTEWYQTAAQPASVKYNQQDVIENTRG
jgi:hypothetical protein